MDKQRRCAGSGNCFDRRCLCDVIARTDQGDAPQGLQKDRSRDDRIFFFLINSGKDIHSRGIGCI